MKEIDFRKYPIENRYKINPMETSASSKKIIEPKFKDEDLKRANILSKNEKTLSLSDKEKLESIREERKAEIDRLFPEFSFEGISELNCSREESTRQYKEAKRYFELLTKLQNVPGGIYNLALYIEKLKDWENNPQEAESNFKNKYRERVKVVNSRPLEYKLAFKNSQEIRYLKQSLEGKKGELSETTKKAVTNTIKYQQVIKDHTLFANLREDVLYNPDLIEGFGDKLRNYYTHMTARKRRAIKESVRLNEENITYFSNVLSSQTEKDSVNKKKAEQGAKEMKLNTIYSLGSAQKVK